MPSVLPGRDEKEVGMTLNGMLIGSDDVHGQFERLKAAGANYFQLVSPFPG